MDNFYSPTTPTMDDLFTTTSPINTTIYTQISNRQEDNIQQTVFDYRDILKKLDEERACSAEKESVDIENKDELDEIKTFVHKGKDLLIRELKQNNVLLDRQQNLTELQNVTKNVCLDFHQKIVQVKTLSERNDCGFEDVQSLIDDLVFSIGSLYDVVQTKTSEKLDSLKKEIDKSGNIVRHLADTYHIIKNVQVGPVCPICLNNSVNIFCDPCGHSFCKKCMQSAMYCYVCRSRVNQLKSLYFP